jgi:hypothetical protein
VILVRQRENLMNLHVFADAAAASGDSIGDSAIKMMWAIVLLFMYLGMGIGAVAFFTRNLWMPFVRAKYPAHFPDPQRTSHHAGKKCGACGAANDDFLTNCKFCNAPLAAAETNGNSNEALLEDVNEFIAVLGNRQAFSMGFVSLSPASRLGKRYGYGIMALSAAMSGMVSVKRKMLLAEAQKTIGMLKIRSLSNPTLATLVNEYAAKLENLK